MKHTCIRNIGAGLFVATQAVACSAPPASTEDVGAAEERSGGGGPTYATQIINPSFAGTEPVPVDGGPEPGRAWHQEIAVGRQTITVSNTSYFAFYDRYGSPINLTGTFTNVLSPATLFAPYFDPSDSRYLNKHLPIAKLPAAGTPVWQSCDPTLPPPSGSGPHFTSACINNYGYDCHTTYDPGRRRFILSCHVRNNNYDDPTDTDFPTGYTEAQVGPYSWRYILFAVSKTENPNDGFYLYENDESYADWPRVGVSGDYFVVSHHGLQGTYESTLPTPLVWLYHMDDLAAGVTSPRKWTFSRSDLGGNKGFLVVPTHDQPLDATGTLWGTGYALGLAVNGSDVPKLYGFVPSASSTGAPTLVSTAMPTSATNGMHSFAGVGVQSAGIRGGNLYSAYTIGSAVHADVQQISTTHGSGTTAINLHPSWGADVSPADSNILYRAPIVEPTADGAAVLGYSVNNGDASTLEVRSTSFLANGSRQPEATWATGAYTGGDVDYRYVNRGSIDPLFTDNVWFIGLEGGGSDNYTPVAQSVHIGSVACTSGTNSQTLPGGVRGCSGNVTWDARSNLCAPGYTVCTAHEWAALRTTYPSLPLASFTPSYNYWTDDVLGYSILAGGCEATTTGGSWCANVLNASGQSVPSPMRVCTPSGSDGISSTCNVANCGLDSTSNDFFGGCVNDPTAGALCCPLSMGCANGLPDDVFTTASAVNGTLHAETRMVGCGGAVTWDQRASLCGPGYSPCKASQWAALPAPPHPSNHYWTDDNLGYSGTFPGACEATTTGGSSCGTVLNASGQPVPAPMRVCNSNHLSSDVDSYGNHCNWTGCGLNSTTNDYFGGCSGNATAGTLCCAD